MAGPEHHLVFPMRLLSIFSFSIHLAWALQTTCPNPLLSPLSAPLRKSPLLVDDDSTSFDIPNLPWTHEPLCSTSFSTIPGEKFCVFSSSSYNLGAGVSFLTTPETAAGLVAVINRVADQWADRRHFKPQEEIQHPDLPYAVISIPGKGKGVIATRKINRFETIMRSFPAIIADNAFFPKEEEDEAGVKFKVTEGGTRKATPAGGPDGSKGFVKGRRYYHRALEQLGDRQRVLNLARSRKGEMHVLEDVIRTNAFGMTINGRDCKGLFPEIARMNHACDPNAFPRFTSKDLVMSAVATRDIMPGEEITISYIPLGMPSSYRAKSLGNWHFNCSCALCTAPPEARDASDSRRERLMELFYAMQDSETQYDALIDWTREFIELAQVERLITKIGEYYQVFMKLYYDKGDPESAKKYGQAALYFAEIFSDPEGGFCTSLREDLQVVEKVLAETKAKAA
ncbi:hypothetical protein QBC40DRAFT_259412 [Triangularia verruculosa]|uniref:SET domain-containing protein n=1 Tax=Triangularia verruculosa TaxID=2587418 RepID=A0AAN7APY7_9PEZI|nr:hypothetical protein QBC40DRAFT_259412 [Triangularia verruculosa]